MSSHRPSRVRRGSLAVLGAAAAVVVMLPACGTPAGVSSADVTPSATSVGGTDVPAANWAAERKSAALAALRVQAEAVIAGDRGAYLAPVAAGPERTRQQRRFDGMRLLGLSHLTLVEVREVVPPVPVAPGTAATWDVEATFDYRIKGFDRAPRRFTLDLTVTAAPAHPGQVSIVGSKPADRPQPWDLEGMQVRRSARSLVAGNVRGPELDEALRRADRAAGEVARVWGAVVPSVWLVPSTEAEAEQLLGRGQGQLEGIAAATDGPLQPGMPAGADRIIVNPAAWSSLRPEGRDVVMTHELTHAAVRASTTRPVPLWLSEGLAEYVGYLSVDVDQSAVAAPLVSRLRRDGLPAHLPGPERFEPGDGSLPAAYAEAWLAVRTLVAAHGQERVMAFYRAAAGGLPVSPARLGDPEAVVDEALHEVLGTTRAALEQRWLAVLRELPAA